MHNNYYFLRQLSKQLRSKLIGFMVGEIYSQHKNELTIHLYAHEEEAIIKAHLDNEFSCLAFPERASRAKRNSVDLFRNIYEHEILDVIQIEHDRSFYLQLNGDFKLLFKMHGNRSNIVLLHGEKVEEVFRNNLRQDLGIEVNALSKSIDVSFQNFEAKNGDYKLICPTFGKAFDKYFQDCGYENQTIQQKYKKFEELLKYLNEPRYFLHMLQNEKPVLSLYQIHEKDKEIENPTDALNHLYQAFLGDYLLQNEKRKMRNGLLAQIKSGEAYIKKTQAKLDKLASADSYSHIADLIMANLHLIKPHTTEATITDFYTQLPVVIKLKTNLTPQHNAEKYYKKAKKQQLEIANLEKNIKQKKAQISELQDEISRLGDIKKFKHLKREKDSKQQFSEPPFYCINFMNYEILIGKNARKNEALTFGIASKDDLFLHAKDSPGSHVIIRHKSNQNFPRLVIEQAASYAAFYSKSKNESLIRVLFTPKKYVRKAKGSPAGTVIVTNEKVVLVKAIEPKK